MQPTRKIIIPFLALTLTLAACANQSAPNSSEAGGLNLPDDRISTTSLAGRFTGILPCTDCSGWDAQLDLNADKTFNLFEHSLDEHEAQILQTTGTWTLVDDGPIPFIALQTEAPNQTTNEPRYYEVISNQQLIFVGFEKKQFETELDYSLTRVDTP